MTFQDLGYTDKFEQYRKEHELDAFAIGRVILEHKDRYVVKTPTQEFDAELIGNLRFTAESRYDLPAVGDWVAYKEYDQDKALIHAVLPRQSCIERKAVGKSGQVQLIATNIDFGLIVQAVDRDFNLNRLERYLTICNASGVQPIIVLSKIDLISAADVDIIIKQIKERIQGVPIVKVSSESVGYKQLAAIMEKGKTYCLLGSSGVGKSTLINGLLGKEVMETAAISDAVNKGKHTTSHRELIVLENGGIIIDNPGMRELGITDAAAGLEITFETILEYAKHCKFKDCTHVHEKGCAILAAVANGQINARAYANFRKMEKEKMHFEADAKERKQKDKDFGKMVKKIKQQRKNNKY